MTIVVETGTPSAVLGLDRVKKVTASSPSWRHGALRQDRVRRPRRDLGKPPTLDRPRSSTRSRSKRPVPWPSARSQRASMPLESSPRRPPGGVGDREAARPAHAPSAFPMRTARGHPRWARESGGRPNAVRCRVVTVGNLDAARSPRSPVRRGDPVPAIPRPSPAPRKPGAGSWGLSVRRRLPCCGRGNPDCGTVPTISRPPRRHGPLHLPPTTGLPSRAQPVTRGRRLPTRSPTRATFRRKGSHPPPRPSSGSAPPPSRDRAPGPPLAGAPPGGASILAEATPPPR